MSHPESGPARRHVVVTGAGGFVGNFLANRLAVQEQKVSAITRGPIPAAAHPHLTWLQSDLAAPASLPPRFDVLVHCAAEIPARCSDADLLYRRNMDVSRVVFQRAIEAGAEAIVFLSSMSVYGNVSTPALTEETTPDRPDAYGQAKWDSEILLQELVAQGLASGLAIRLPGTVGRGSHHNFLSDAMRRVLADEIVSAKNPDALFNNIVYVGDLASFIRQWAEKPRTGYNVTNLAAREPLAIRTVLSRLFKHAKKPEQLRFETGGKLPFLISLDRALSLGYASPTVEASIEAMVRDCLTP
jgi:nucleoside-diphosphate-sugar epimerase